MEIKPKEAALNIFEAYRRTLKREVLFILRTPVVWVTMLIFPVLAMVFFSSIMDEGVPKDLPVGVVDLDKSHFSRQLTRTLDAFEHVRVAARYGSMKGARLAVQRGEIYGFLVVRSGTEEQLLSQRQPRIACYMSNTSLAAGNLVYKDMKTVLLLASASVASPMLQARGLTREQTEAFLQPIVVDSFEVGNPWLSYNVYLSTMFIPGSMLLLLMLLTSYLIGVEMKNGTQREWLQAADGRMSVALLGKMTPLLLSFLLMFLIYGIYIFGFKSFPHKCSFWVITLINTLAVLGSMGFAVMICAVIPSMRLSMSTCSLWAVLSFSLSGAAYPLFCMDKMLQGIAQLFPLRHYWSMYHLSVLNSFPLSSGLWHIACLSVFAALPLLVLGRLKHCLLKYEYSA